MTVHDPTGRDFCKCDDCQSILRLISKGLVRRALAQVIEDLGYPPSWVDALRDGKFQDGGLVEVGATVFRWHRGSLDESMASSVPCRTLAQLVGILRTGMGLGDVSAERVDVKRYTFDERTGWDTHLVTVDGNAVGMTNGALA